MYEETRERVIQLRWLVLVLMSFVTFGCYYAYDSVVPIAEYIIKDMGITKAQYGLLFSYYSLPNFIMVLLGGILLDKIGIRKAGTLFACICATGILVTAAGSTFQLMLLGRLIYGVGAESLNVTAIKVLSKWFRGKELSLTIGLNASLFRLGNIASLNLGVPLSALSGSWRFTLWVSVFIMLMGFAIFLVYARVDKATEQYFKIEEQGTETEKFVLRVIFKFKPSYWYISLLCMTFYSAILPFIAFSNMFFQKKYGLSASQGGFYASLVFIGAMIFTPILGFFIDKTGKRATLMIFGSLLLIPVHFSFGLSSIPIAAPMIALGISYALVPAALWPSIPILIPERHLGIAFGLVYLIQNIGLTIFPWAAGKITDISVGEYTYTMIMFASLGFLAFLFSLALRFSERKGKATGIELPTKIAQKTNVR